MAKKGFLWLVLSGILFLAVLGNYIFYEYRLNSAFNETRQRLIAVASNAALSIDSEELLKVPLEQSGDYSPEYQDIYQQLVRIKEINPFLKYVYILTTTEQPGILQFVVDADPVPEIITARCPSALPGDKYDARPFPEMMEAYARPTADKKITTDVWGTVISGYAPIYDATGKPVAIMGVDTDASAMRLMREKGRSRALFTVFAGLLFFMSLILLFFLRAFRPPNNPQ